MKKILYTLIIGLFCASFANGQGRIVALNQAGDLFEIDKKLERKHTFFPTYQPFISAKLLQDDSTHFTLEIHYYRDEVIHRENKPMSLAQVENLRADISSRVDQDKFTFERSGRNIFLISSALTGAGYYGWAIPKAAGVEDSRAALGLYAATFGATYLTNYFLVRGKDISIAEGAFGNYGQIRGIIDGVAISYLFNPEPSLESQLGIGVAASMVEGLGGLFLSRYHNADLQSYKVVRATSFWGAMFGFSAASFAGFEFDNPAHYDGIAACYLAGSAASIVTGFHMSKKQDYSKGDITMLHTSAFAASLIPMSVMSIFDASSDPKLLFGATSFGIAGGIIAGHLITQNVNFTDGQAQRVSSATFGLGLLGLSAGALAAPKNDDFEEAAPYLIVGTALGAVTGYLISTNNAMKRLTDKGVLSDLDLQIHPEGIMSMNSKSTNIRQQMSAPMLTAKWSF